MDILKYIKTFLHYIFTPFRMLLCVIVMNLLHKISEHCDSLTTLYMFALLLGKSMMYLLGVSIEIDEEDLIKYSKYLYSDKKLISVLNHTSLIDGYVLLATFERYSVVLLKNPIYKWLGYSDVVHEKYRNIFVEKNNTTKEIINKVSTRKPGQPILFVAPGSGNTPKNPDNITEFHGNGAFVGKFSILPVTFRYEDESIHHNQDNGESFIHSTLKLFVLNNNYKIRVKVGDIIDADEKESVDEYKQRVYTIMNKQYQDMKIDHHNNM
jgi:1-acyl-sn-glycerol-3-phosphate acyltransferase